METYNYTEFKRKIQETFLPEYPNVTIKKDEMEPWNVFISIRDKNILFNFSINECDLMYYSKPVLDQFPLILKQQFKEAINGHNTVV